MRQEKNKKIGGSRDKGGLVKTAALFTLRARVSHWRRVGEAADSASFIDKSPTQPQGFFPPSSLAIAPLLLHSAVVEALDLSVCILGM
jgi:hypothetical protein